MTSATIDQQATGSGATTQHASYDCPHCHKPFEPVVDAGQPPRLRGAKCPHCKLMVPARTLERLAVDD